MDTLTSDTSPKLKDAGFLIKYSVELTVDAVEYVVGFLCRNRSLPYQHLSQILCRFGRRICRQASHGFKLD